MFLLWWLFPIKLIVPSKLKTTSKQIQQKRAPSIPFCLELSVMHIIKILLSL